MLTSIDKLTKNGCEGSRHGSRGGSKPLCRARGGESCAFDGAMIVLQPIADAAHIVHGPIACLGNSWEGRGTLSSKGSLHRAGVTTGMGEMDIVYGSREKLYKAVLETYEALKPKAVFVYATCVSGLMGEDIEAVCRKAEEKLGIRVIPVSAPGFVGPKNLGNRIAGEVLLDYVIGTGEPPFMTDCDINIIGEYNIAGDLYLIEPLLKEAGINVLSRITGDSTFEEITYAHRAKLNVVVCSRALINVAKEMERKYGIPYIEASFFGKTEMSKALRAMADAIGNVAVKEKVEAVIEKEERKLDDGLGAYPHLRGKRAVLYTGGVKSWSFISALMDLGIEVAAVGTKKSTFEDEEKMKVILGSDAPLVEDVSPHNLLRLIRDKRADILVAGGRNQYLAVKEGIPFVDVNQERHTAYAGYGGLLNLARDIAESVLFYGDKEPPAPRITRLQGNVLINPLGHSQSVGAAIALQGIDGAIPVIHGAQGCGFLQKVLLTKHFREPVSLQSSRLFTEDVVMGSDEALERAIGGIVEKNKPRLIGVLTSGLSEIKGDDVGGVVKNFKAPCAVLHIPTPDYEGGIETGYAKAVVKVLTLAEKRTSKPVRGQINVLAGGHLTPADFVELREITESFGLKALILPDLSSLDGSRQGFSPLAEGGIKVGEIEKMRGSMFTLAIGGSMETPASYLKEAFAIEYKVFKSISGLRDTDMLMETLSMLGGTPVAGSPVASRYRRQRNILIDGLRDAHFHLRGKRVCIALDPDLSVQTSRWLAETGAEVLLSVVPTESQALEHIIAKEVLVGDLHSIEGEFDLLISNSHAEDTARRLGVPLYQMGFPVYKSFGYCSKITIGYAGTLSCIIEAANMLLKR